MIHPVAVKTEVILTGFIPLWDMNSTSQFDVNIEILRVGCTESNRSTILVSLVRISRGDSFTNDSIRFSYFLFPAAC